MGNFLKLTSGLAIVIGIHVTSCYAVLAEVTAPGYRALPSNPGNQTIQLNHPATPAGHLMGPGTKDSSSYEPPVEGGPQTSQGSGTR